ncbi:S9 family peptidase [Amycolatopsis acidiphila]|uniref:S9 family peptidase n=1 Tax=Amycolatopsis acidiphila TaxID=715473 RepID=A0A558A0R3_9PSEU|nr:S9 family peptidase [Amycolatopsis acidiphila]TVT17841.1 S9 family peptidase [Amycolatopsis acidiphila]UIJ62232.1 S9 family peptidase [Amycolatopsis acidiphila]GHG92769.1 dipeptidyl aminopeptidase [Amycolatopsis acidiphila]
MRPSDIELLSTPSTPALHGDLLLTGVSTPDPEGNVYRGALWRVGLDGTVRPWTHGERDSAPVISPDGRWAAFLRAAEAKSSPQLYVMPSDGGDARRLTDLPLGAGHPVWAPDSRRIAFTARVPEPGRYGVPTATGEKPEPGEEAPRHIKRFDYRIDNIGFLRDRPERLFVVDALEPADEPTPLTDEQVDVSEPVWTPDGQTILVVAPRDWGAAQTEESDLYAVPLAGGEPRLAVRSAGGVEKATVGEDGTVWFIGAEFTWPYAEARNPGLWAARLSGEAATPRRLTDAETVHCFAGAGAPAVFGDELLVAVLNRGAVELRAVPRDAEEAPLDKLAVLAGERAAVRSFAVDGDRIAAVVARPDSTGDVVLISGGAQQVLTDWSKPLRDKGIRPLEELTASTPDGYPVHGWLVEPEGDGPHPVLLVVHGGPFAAYDWGLFDEAQVYASAGYAVVLANPRGSAGYGQSHGRAIVRAFGTVDVDDLLALLDSALERPGLDASRVGVMGGSYGGFMTSWLASHHGERFRAAWSERAVNAWDSMVGSSDIGWSFVDAYIGGDLATQLDRSPLTYADRIGIPFMVVHSEHDWRCPVEQAQRLYVALKRNGADVEMLLFPGEGHELSRSGKPRHRVQRLEAVLEWWSRHL